jgi:carboxymethylenebutenolidase
MNASSINAVMHESVTYPGPSGQLQGEVFVPQGAGQLPGIVLVHENRGLDDHIRGIARRLAAEGFRVLAVDALCEEGGPKADLEATQKAIGALDVAHNVANQLAAVDYLAEHPQGNGTVGCLGFCWGGGVTNQVAVASGRLNAGVVYYGKSPAPEQVPSITAPMLLHYAEDDGSVNPTVPPYQAALDAHGKRYTLYQYEGAKHAFNNDVRPDRHDPEASALAWRRTVDFLSQELKN